MKILNIYQGDVLGIPVPGRSHKFGHDEPTHYFQDDILVTPNLMTSI